MYEDTIQLSFSPILIGQPAGQGLIWGSKFVRSSFVVDTTHPPGYFSMYLVCGQRFLINPSGARPLLSRDHLLVPAAERSECGRLSIVSGRFFDRAREKRIIYSSKYKLTTMMTANGSVLCSTQQLVCYNRKLTQE
jgi:hypothetical protein